MKELYIEPISTLKPLFFSIVSTLICVDGFYFLYHPVDLYLKIQPIMSVTNSIYTLMLTFPQSKKSSKTFLMFQ